MPIFPNLYEYCMYTNNIHKNLKKIENSEVEQIQKLIV